MADSLLISNAQIVTPQETIVGWLRTEQGRIAAIGTGVPPSISGGALIDAQNGWLLPGFIDVHVHGALGCDTMDARPESLLKMAHFFARHGVTSFFPTTMTAPHDQLMAALRTVKVLTGQRTGGAHILGAHLEGPYINQKMVGAQNPAYVRRAASAETRELLNLDVIRRITLAPEFPENQAFIRDAAALGIAVSAGHTQADDDAMRAAIQMGLRHTTHTFNAMIGLHHRAPGTVGAALGFGELTCELIADTVHVHPLVMKVLWLAKGSQSVILITDSMGGAGMPDGQYDLGGQSVTVAGGEAHLTEGGSLAGSILTMERGVTNMAHACDLTLAQMHAMSSANAAKAHPVTKNKGVLAVSRDADMIIMTSTGQVRWTVVGGEVVYNASLPQ